MRKWKCVNTTSQCPAALAGHVFDVDDQYDAPACPNCQNGMVELPKVVRGRKLRRRVVGLLIFLFLFAAAGGVAFYFLRTPLVLTDLVSGEVGKPLSGKVRAWFAITQYEIDRSAGDAAPWLQIDPKTGVLTGEPVKEGNYNLTLKVTNRFGTTVKPLTVSIAPGIDRPPQFTSAASADATVGKPFAFNITVSPRPETLAVDGLPPWLRRVRDASTGLDSRLEGTPPGASKVVLTLRAEIKGKPAATTQLAIDVQVTEAPTLTTRPKYDVEVGEVSFDIAYTPMDAKVSGTLPPGLRVSASAGVATVSGRLASAGLFEATLVAENPRGKASKGFQIEAKSAIGPAVVVKEQSFEAFVGVPFSKRVQALRGATEFRTEGAGLPASSGLTFDRTTGEIKGTPTTPGVLNFQVGAKNQASPEWSSAEDVRIEVKQPPFDPERPVAALRLTIPALRDLAVTLDEFDEIRAEMARKDISADSQAFYRDTLLPRKQEKFTKYASQLATTTAELKTAPPEAVRLALGKLERESGDVAEALTWLVQDRSLWGSASAIELKAVDSPELKKLGKAVRAAQKAKDKPR